MSYSLLEAYRGCTQDPGADEAEQVDSKASPKLKWKPIEDSSRIRAPLHFNVMLYVMYGAIFPVLRHCHRPQLYLK